MGSLYEKSKKLLNNGMFTDVTFVVGSKDEDISRINAHRYILSASSPVFHSLFMEAAKDKKEFPVVDMSPAFFKQLLTYLYTNEDPSIDAENWASMLYAAEKYELYPLKEKCLGFVEANCNARNALQFFNRGKSHYVDSFMPFVKCHIGYNDIKNSLLEIQDKDLLAEFLSLDELDCDEIVIFKEALRWAAHQIEDANKKTEGDKLREVLGSAFYEIRFPILNAKEFKEEVVPTGVLTDTEILSIVTKKKNNNLCQFKSGLRTRSCKRFANTYRATLRTQVHSIKFKVDCRVNIYGFGIYRPYEEDGIISGTIILKKVVEKADDEVLGEKSFNLQFDNVLKIGYVNFVNCINVDPNTEYLVQLKLDRINVNTRVGIDGNSKVVIDGVQWTFNNHDNLSETCILKGQLPIIKFSKFCL